MLSSEVRWTNPSVLAFANGQEPLSAIERAVRQLALRALDHGWSGPPYDPFALAKVLGYEVAISDEIRDAMVSQEPGKRPTITFNPSQALSRINFSVAHEIVHTLFADFAERPRYRQKGGPEDSWQLEMLCNVGAAELLMPADDFLGSIPDQLSIDWVLQARAKLRISTEAILLRLARLADFACGVFCASRISELGAKPKIRLDYLVTSRAMPLSHKTRHLNTSSSIEQCTAILFTAKGVEEWPMFDGSLRVECVGLPGYHGQTFPRVAGFILPTLHLPKASPTMEFLIGDATDPRGSGPRIVAQIVNNRTPTWSPGGFSGAVKRKWPEAQREFRMWAEADRSNLQLGKSNFVSLGADLSVASLVAQAGYGPSEAPRLKYEALRECLRTLSKFARERDATVHIPRIGTGQARGSWEVVRDLIEDELTSRGTRVFVYDLPQQRM